MEKDGKSKKFVVYGISQYINFADQANEANLPNDLSTLMLSSDMFLLLCVEPNSCNSSKGSITEFHK